MKDLYNQRGVSSGKEDVHFAIKKLDKGLFPKAFCKVMPDLVAHDENYCNVMHADGTGTKTSLAYIYWKETADLSVWEGIAQDAIVMNLDDMMCVGAVNNFLMSNTIGRNKFRIPRDVIATLINGMQSFFEMLSSHGVKVHNTGGETADVGDLVQTLIFDATAFCRMPRKEVITNEKIGPNSVIVGLSSFGQATYETRYNGGMGSNGLTSARHDSFAKVYATKYPESFDAQVPNELVYSGKHLLTEPIESLGINVGQLILSPTRTYLPIMKQVFDQHRNNIHGMIHCTGGGQTKCLKFVEGLHIIKNNLFPLPLSFQLIQEASQTEWKEMYKVFNMGHRLEIYTDEQTAQSIIEIAQSFKVEAQIIGHCEAADKNKLTIKSPYGEFIYQ